MTAYNATRRLNNQLLEVGSDWVSIAYVATGLLPLEMDNPDGAGNVIDLWLFDGAIFAMGRDALLANR